MARYFASLPESARQVEAALAGAPRWTFPLVVLTAGRSESHVARHRALAQCSTRGRHVVVEVAGHWVHLDAPAAVVLAIRDVIAEALQA